MSGFMPWLRVGWPSLLFFRRAYLYPELVPFHSEGEWKKQCWRKREESKRGADMQWMKPRVKERARASSQSVQGKNSSQYVQSSLDVQTSQVWQLLWVLLPASLLTVLSCSSSPGPDGEKAFSWSYGPGVLWGSQPGDVERSVASFER